MKQKPKFVCFWQDRIKGGFGGGPRQLPHCAPMYASVLSLLIVGTPEAYDVIDRCVVYVASELESCYACFVLFCTVIQNFICIGFACVCRRVAILGSRGWFGIYSYEELKGKGLGSWRMPSKNRVGNFILRPLIVGDTLSVNFLPLSVCHSPLTRFRRGKVFS